MEADGAMLRQAWTSQLHLDFKQEEREEHEESHIFGGFAVQGGVAGTVDFVQTRLERRVGGGGSRPRGEVPQEDTPSRRQKV